MQISLFGPPASGKSVFMSLLYTTALEYSCKMGKEDRGGNLLDRFIVSSDSKSISSLQNSIKELYQGSWSRAVPISSIGNPCLNLGFLEADGDEYRTISLVNHDYSSIAIEGLLNIISVESNQNVVSRQIKEYVIQNQPLDILFKSNILVFFIDSDRILSAFEHWEHMENGGIPRVVSLDSELSLLLSTIVQWKLSHENAENVGLKIMVVFTKFDKIFRNKGILNGLMSSYRIDILSKKSLKEDPILDDIYKNRESYGTALLEEYFPNLYACMKGMSVTCRNNPQISFFFVHIMTIIDKVTGFPLPKLDFRPDMRSLDYSRSEFIRIIEKIKEWSEELGVYYPDCLDLRE